MTRIRAGTRGLGIVSGLAVVLAVAACGSSSSTTQTSNASASSSSSTAASSSSASGVRVDMAKGSVGDYLTGPGGRAVYVWAADSTGKSSCSGQCATTWPPLTTTGAAGAGSGVIASHVGTITRSDGAKQVTYMGHPLYYYAGDTGAGSTNGQGSNNFGAKWWLVSPSGAPITKAAAAGGSSSGSSTSTSGGGWG